MQAEEILINIGTGYATISAFLLVACIVMDRVEAYMYRNKPKRAGEYPFVINVLLYILLAVVWLPYVMVDLYKSSKKFITTK